MAVEILAGWAPIIVGLELKTGTSGVFKVSLDGAVVYDKTETKRTPLPGELADRLKESLGPPMKWRKDRSGA